MARWSARITARLWALFYFLVQTLNHLLGFILFRRSPAPEKRINVSQAPPLFDQHPIAVIIPALNEATVLPNTIKRVFSTCTLPSSRGCAEPTVIVVDASSDGT